MDKGVPLLLSTNCSLGVYNHKENFASLWSIMYCLFLLFSFSVSCALFVQSGLSVFSLLFLLFLYYFSPLFDPPYDQFDSAFCLFLVHFFIMLCIGLFFLQRILLVWPLLPNSFFNSLHRRSQWMFPLNKVCRDNRGYTF